MLNRTDRPAPMPGEADVKYLDGDFRVVRPGAFVRCAVTGIAIPPEALRYWSVDLQKPMPRPKPWRSGRLIRAKSSAADQLRLVALSTSCRN